MSRTDTASRPYLANSRSPAVMRRARVRSPATFPSARSAALAPTKSRYPADAMTGRLTILDPRVRPPDDADAPTFDVATSLHGVVVGLRLDRSWRSYMIVVDEWERRLRADGATVRVLVTGERVGPEG